MKDESETTREMTKKQQVKARMARQSRGKVNAHTVGNGYVMLDHVLQYHYQDIADHSYLVGPDTSSLEFLINLFTA